ncbi:MAG: DegV family protein [Chloroflexota bacterium]
MPRTAIITDTDSSLPIDLAERYNIVQVPIIIQFGEETLRDVYDIDNARLFARIDREGRLPTTAAPSPGQFIQAYEQAFASGADSVLCFTISSEMSAVYQSAHSATEMFPGKDITVVDTRNLSIGQGFMVLAAAEALAKGASKDEALAIAIETNQRCHLFAALSTLKYLAMSGRVGHLAAGVAGLLDVKPILSTIDGKLQMLERVRTQRKSWERVIELAVEATARKGIERMALLHVNAGDPAKEFEKQVSKALPCPEIQFIEMNPGLSIHSGAGLVGVVFITEK